MRYLREEPLCYYIWCNNCAIALPILNELNYFRYVVYIYFSLYLFHVESFLLYFDLRRRGRGCYNEALYKHDL